MDEYKRLADRVDGCRITENLSRLARITDPAFSDVGVTRLTLSEYDFRAKEFICELMREAGLKVSISPVGNVFGKLSGSQSDTRVVMSGSHTDSVINGGRFDGTVGVVCAIEALRVLSEVKDSLRHPLVAVDFSGEESARFGLSVFGSKVFTGELSPQLLRLRDQDGITLSDALGAVESWRRSLGDEVPVESLQEWSEARAKNAVAHSKGDIEQIEAFVELHVEQAGYLEESGRSIGIVNGAAMPTRWDIQIVGEQSHSGTTPMHRRKNALTAAAEFVLLVDRLCKEEAVNGTVGAVTKLNVHPNVMNTVPGNVSMFLDLRGVDKNSKDRVKASLLSELELICRSHDVSFEYSVIGDDDPKRFSSSIMATVEQSCEELSYSSMILPSRAGHDSCIMSNHLANVGMIFIPSRGGVSHHCDEWSDPEDIISGAKVLLLTLLKLATQE